MRSRATIFAYFAHSFALLLSLVYYLAVSVEIYNWPLHEEHQNSENEDRKNEDDFIIDGPYCNFQP